MSEISLRRIDDTLWEIPASARDDMRVPARVFGDAELLDAIRDDRSLEQLQNVATLPGIVEAAMAMPDIHQGYGFPVGTVASTAEPDGVVSPGGVGYDINCGVRLLAAPFSAEELGDRRHALVHEISRSVPVGAGRESSLGVGGRELENVLRHGAEALLDSRGIGTEEDIYLTESGGCIAGADPASVSERALARGSGQLGTLGSGNHFIELQRAEHILEEEAAAAYGLR
jgi:tRNA-splicing ligase RtcB